MLADDVVRFAGEPVAIVAAADPETARRAAAAVAVEYEVLPAVTDMAEALRADAPQLHDFGNVLRHVHIEHGDPDAAADVWVEGYYETAMQDNAPLGPEAGLAYPSPDGGVDLHVNTQWLHVDLHQMAACLDLPEEKVRITLAGMGGAFGAREDIHLQVHACMLALRTGRPVKIEYGREESFLGHKQRHPSRLWMRHGATRDGRLVSVRARLLIDGGAYASSSPAVVANASTFAARSLRGAERRRRRDRGVHEQPAVRRDAWVRRAAGVLRARGADGQAGGGGRSLAARAPAPQRRRHRVDPSDGPADPGLGARPRAAGAARGDAAAAGRADGGTGRHRLPGGRGQRRAAARASAGASATRSATRTWATARGSTTRPRRASRFMRGMDGPVAEIHTAAVECGQGLLTVLTQIARTELGACDVRFLPHDTGVGSAGSTSASRQTMMAGGAVQMACRAVLDELSRRAGRRVEPGGDPLDEWLVEPAGRGTPSTTTAARRTSTRTARATST